jgi:hypothetical protein
VVYAFFEGKEAKPKPALQDAFDQASPRAS